jgi:transposase
MSNGKKESTFQRLESGNRRQRKDLKRRLYSENPGLEIVHPCAAGIDIGNESHFVAVAPARDPRPVREFGSWTADLNRMAEWLQACGITTVAMQSTGVYWFAAYDILEQHGLEVFLVNARHTKNLPGRKTDVQESQWLLKLHTYGLLRNSFRPPEDIRQIRTVWRLRNRHVQEAGRTIQHMQKALISMNIHLSNAISDLSGVSGQAIIRAILQGQRDPRQLARLRDRRIKASEEEIAHSLEGIGRDDFLFELQQAVDEYDLRQRQLAECDQRLEAYLGALPSRPSPATEGPDPEPILPETATKPKRKKKKNPSSNAPKSFPLATELTRVCGVDATRIDGVDVMTIMTVVAELGVNLEAHWPTENHFTSWLNLSPKRDISGGKVIRHVREKSSNRVASVLRMAASSLLRSDSFLGARYRHLRTRLGSPKAIKAMARYLACLIYRLFTRGQRWVDRGTSNFEIERRQRELSALERKANSLGLRLIPAPQQAA